MPQSTPASSRFRHCGPGAPWAFPRGSSGGQVEPRLPWLAEEAGVWRSPAGPAAWQLRCPHTPAAAFPPPCSWGILDSPPCVTTPSRPLFFSHLLLLSDSGQKGCALGGVRCLPCEFWQPLRACPSPLGTQDPALAAALQVGAHPTVVTASLFSLAWGVCPQATL